MSRSLKKGPYLDFTLIDKIEKLNSLKQKKVIKTWSRACTITPDFVGHTFAVHNGNKFIPVYVSENMVGHKLGSSHIQGLSELIPAKEKKRRQEVNKMEARALKRHIPTSPRKMRLVVDLIRNKRVDEAVSILRFTNKNTAKVIEQTLLSAYSNLVNKLDSGRITQNEVFVKEAFVNGGPSLKRILPAPQGRAFKIRKRSAHLTLIVEQLEEKIK